ncbi:DNA repair protein rad51c [Umbelopsis sp. WA50703]
MSHPRRDRSWFSLRLYMVDVEELGLEPDLCFKLRDIGVNTVEQARKRDLALICRDLDLSHKEVDHLYAAVHKDSMPQIYSCIELLQRGPKLRYIPTFCESFNALLSDNGIPVGKLIEFCGSPGTGKTQLGMQLAINTQISSKLTASETEAVYIGKSLSKHIFN